MNCVICKRTGQGGLNSARYVSTANIRAVGSWSIRLALHPGRDARRFAESELLTSFPTAHLTNHARSRGNANPDQCGLRELTVDLV